MTAARNLLAELQQRGIHLEAVGTTLRYRAPKGALTPDLRARLKVHKAELLSTLEYGNFSPKFPQVSRCPACNAHVNPIWERCLACNAPLKRTSSTCADNVIPFPRYKDLGRAMLKREGCEEHKWSDYYPSKKVRVAKIIHDAKETSE